MWLKKNQSDKVASWRHLNWAQWPKWSRPVHSMCTMQSCFWIIGMFTCRYTHMDTPTKRIAGFLITTTHCFILVLFRGAFGSNEELERHQGEDCGRVWSSATGVACDYSSKDLNEYTISGTLTDSLLCRKFSEHSVPNYCSMSLLLWRISGFSGFAEGKFKMNCWGRWLKC